MNSATSARAIFVPPGRAYPGPPHDGPVEPALAHCDLHLAEVRERTLRGRRPEEPAEQPALLAGGLASGATHRQTDETAPRPAGAHGAHHVEHALRGAC